MLKTLSRVITKNAARIAAARRRRSLRPTLALEQLESRWVLDGTIGMEQPLVPESESSASVPAIISTSSPKVCASGTSLGDFLPSGYQYGPNSSSDPVFQEAYADWMDCQAQVTPSSATSGVSGGSAGGWLDNYAEWFNSTFGSGDSETLGGAIYNILPVSNETLANASDTSLLVGTTIASIPIAVGIVAGGEVVLGVGTLGGAATTAGTATTVVTGVTVTEGAAGTTTAVVMTEGAALGTGTIIVGAEATTIAGTGTVIVMAEGGTAASAATGTTIVTMGGPTVIAVGSTVFPTSTIVTGSSTVVFGHGVLHLVGTTMTQGTVEAAIAVSATEIVAAGATSGTFQIVVSGVTIEFRMAVVDGIIRIGTYFPL